MPILTEPLLKAFKDSLQKELNSTYSKGILAGLTGGVAPSAPAPAPAATNPVAAPVEAAKITQTRTSTGY